MPTGIRVAGAYVDISANAQPYRHGVNQAIAQNRRFGSSVATLTPVLSRFGSSVTSSLIATAAYAVGVGLVSQALGGSARRFLEFEKGLTGVRKTAGLTAVQTEILGRGIRSLVTDISSLGGPLPIARKDLTAIAEVAGQMGITGVRDIKRFTETIGLLTITTDLAGAASANAIGKILQTTSAGVDEVDRLGSSLTALGNKFRGGESDILGQANFLATQTAAFNLPTQDILAYSAALAAGGQRAETAGTAFQRLFQTLTDAAAEAGSGNIARLAAISQYAGDTTQTLEQRVESLRQTITSGDYNTGLLTFLEALRNAGPQGTGNIFTTLFGGQTPPTRLAGVFGFLAKNIGEVNRALGISNKEWERNRATQEEAAIFARRVGGRYQIVGQQISDVTLDIGRALAVGFLPVAENFETIEAGIIGVGASLLYNFGSRQVSRFQETGRALRSESKQASRAFIRQRDEVAKLDTRYRDSLASRRVYLQSLQRERILRRQLVTQTQVQSAAEARSVATARTAAATRAQVGPVYGAIGAAAIDRDATKARAALAKVNERVERTTARLAQVEAARLSTGINSSQAFTAQKGKEEKLRRRLNKATAEQNRLGAVAVRSNTAAARSLRLLGGAFRFIGGFPTLLIAGFAALASGVIDFRSETDKTIGRAREFAQGLRAIADEQERVAKGLTQEGVAITNARQAYETLRKEQERLQKFIANPTREGFFGTIRLTRNSHEVNLARRNLKALEKEMADLRAEMVRVNAVQDDTISDYSRAAQALAALDAQVARTRNQFVGFNKELALVGTNYNLAVRSITNQFKDAAAQDNLSTNLFGDGDPRDVGVQIRARLDMEIQRRIRQAEVERDQARAKVAVEKTALEFAEKQVDLRRAANRVTGEDFKTAQAAVKSGERNVINAQKTLVAKDAALVKARGLAANETILTAATDRTTAAIRKRNEEYRRSQAASAPLPSPALREQIRQEGLLRQPVVGPDVQARRASADFLLLLRGRIDSSRILLEQEKQLLKASDRAAAGLRARFEVEGQYRSAQLNSAQRLIDAQREQSDAGAELVALRARQGQLHISEINLLDGLLENVRERLNAADEQVKAAEAEGVALEKLRPKVDALAKSYGRLAMQRFGQTDQFEVFNRDLALIPDRINAQVKRLRTQIERETINIEIGTGFGNDSAVAIEAKTLALYRQRFEAAKDTLSVRLEETETARFATNAEIRNLENQRKSGRLSAKADRSAKNRLINLREQEKSEGRKVKTAKTALDYATQFLTVDRFRDVIDKNIEAREIRRRAAAEGPLASEFETPADERQFRAPDVPAIVEARRANADLVQSLRDRAEQTRVAALQEQALAAETDGRTAAGLRAQLSVERQAASESRLRDNLIEAKRAEADAGAALVEFRRRLSSANEAERSRLVELVKASEESLRVTERQTDIAQKQIELYPQVAAAIAELAEAERRRAEQQFQPQGERDLLGLTRVPDITKDVGLLEFGMRGAVGAIGDFKGALIDTFTTGRFEVGKFAEAIATRLISSLLDTIVVANLARAALSFFGSLGIGGGGFTGTGVGRVPVGFGHSGGIGASLPAFRPRSLRYGERLAVIKDDEEVLTSRDPRHRWNARGASWPSVREWMGRLPRYHEGRPPIGGGSGGGGGGREGMKVRVELRNESGAQLETVDDGTRFDMEGMVIGIGLKDAAKRGPMTQAFLQAAGIR